jgi:ubiquitin carboxyl-terminal hydrolase 25/28
MVQSAKGVTSTTYQLQDNILASPGDCARHIYRALDDEFDLQPVEGMNGLKYEEISQLPPMLMINVRRLIFDKEKGAAKRNESHLRMDEVLYFDRYLEQTSSLSSAELLGLREKKWEIDKQRRTLEERRSLLKSSELGTNLAEAADETSEFLNSLQTPDPDTLIELDNIPVPLGVSEEIRNKAEDIRKEQEGLDKSIEFVEETINSYFEKLKDHPYRLQAVFIHRGSAAGGHYYIYIHDFKTNIWRKYNDETVEEVTDLREIFEQEEKHPGISTGMVYVKNDAVKDLVEAVKREPNVPDPLPPAMTLNADNSWQYDQHASQQDIDMVDAMSYGDVQYIDGVAADGPCSLLDSRPVMN